MPHFVYLFLGVDECESVASCRIAFAGEHGPDHVLGYVAGYFSFGGKFVCMSVADISGIAFEVHLLAHMAADNAAAIVEPAVYGVARDKAVSVGLI